MDDQRNSVFGFRLMSFLQIFRMLFLANKHKNSPASTGNEMNCV